MVLALYRHQFGTIPIDLKQPAADLDVAAAWTPDRKAITISIVNATDKPRTLAVDLGKTKVKDEATRWEVTGSSPELHNEPGLTPDLIRAVEKQVTFANKLEAPPYSAELYRLEIE
jgi:alpha-L-arabinofuranosidase